MFGRHNEMRAVGLWCLAANALVTADKYGSTPASSTEGVLRMPILPHKVVRRRLFEESLRDRSLSEQRDKTLGMSALYQGYGTHYVDLWVGTPNPQRQTVIVDTGSSITAFPCAGCHNCGYDGDAKDGSEQYHTDNYFDPALSSTFSKLGCDSCEAGTCSSNECKMHMSYAEGSSWSAFEAQDFLYAGGSHQHGISISVDPETKEVIIDPEDEESLTTKFGVPYNFGCQMSLTGLFRTQLADGIMGMSNEPHTFWDQIYQHGKIPKKQFSLCFSRQDSIEYDGTDAGAMTIGGTDKVLHKTPMVYARETKGGGFFTVHVRKIFLRNGGGESAALEPDMKSDDMQKIDISESQLNSHGVIIDSGTTDTYFTHDLATSFRNIWQEMTGSPYMNKPVKMTKEEIAKLPTVIIQLEGMPESYYQKVHPGETVEPQHVVGMAGELDQEQPFDVFLAIPASHYYEYDDEKDMYTPRIYLDERSGSVLGANAMQGHDFFFNMEDKVVGIAESLCDYPAVSGKGVESSKKAVDPPVIDTTTVEEEQGRTRDPYQNANDGDNGFTYHSSSNNSEACESAVCRGLVGVGSLMFICVVVLGIPALKRFRARRRRVPVHHAVDDEVSDHHAMNVDYDDDVGAVEIMNSGERRAMV